MPKYCFNCMRPLDASPVCRFCGHNNVKRFASAEHYLKPSTVLSNRYLLGNALGEGGFGVTYIGLDTTLSKRVAIKEFYPTGYANRAQDGSVVPVPGKEEFIERGVARFLEEAKNVAAFSDEDGIVDVLDYFQANRTAYIVMEYLEGETLKEYINKRGPFQAERIFGLMFPVMRSLKLMHARGVIHRDISPDNIMLTKSGKLKLMDFGSARYYTSEEKQMSIMLKKGFAPEEQYRRSGRQGPFTDVYALCATIYTCITGIVPPDSIDRLAHDTLTPPSAMGVTISRPQERALMHGLAVYAQNRCPNMETLMTEINGSSPYRGAVTAAPGNYRDNWNRPQSAQSQPLPDPRPKKKKKSNAPLIVAVSVSAAVVIALVVVIIFIINSNKSSAEPAVTQPVTQAYTEPEKTSPTHSNEAVEQTTAAVTTEEPTTEEPTTEEPTTEEPATEEATISVEEAVSAIRSKYEAVTNSKITPTEVNGYDVVRTDDGKLWISLPVGGAKDYEDQKWYFFDENGKLFYIYEKLDNEEYRYYIQDDQIIRYVKGKSFFRDQYDYGDPRITDEMKTKIYEAYGAQFTINN